MKNPVLLIAIFLTGAAQIAIAAQDQIDFSPKPDERQLPKKMHSAMKTVPHMTVGHAVSLLPNADAARVALEAALAACSRRGPSS